MGRIKSVMLSVCLFTTMTFSPLITETNTSHTGIKQTDIHYTFGEEIIFEAEVDSPEQVQHINLFIHPEGQNTSIHDVQISNSHLEYHFDVKKDPVRPFAQIEYWYRLTTRDGVEKSSKYSFLYEDNRFTWEHIEDGYLNINWVGDQMSLGQDVLDISQDGLKSAQQYLPLHLQRNVRIYIYPSSTDLQSAIQLSQINWAAGHASPDMGIILISAQDGPDQKLELERQIPHEIMHILQYQMTGNTYQQQPLWFIEGMASLAEIYPNPDYEASILKAIDEQTLYPISSLCTSFPQDKNEAFLAYAESASFVRYLHHNYGASGLQKLLTQYSDGLSCANGVQAAFSIPLSQLENRWLQEISGEKQNNFILQNLMPYFFLLLVVTLIPLFPLFILRRKQPSK